MLKVTVYQDSDGQALGFQISGHSGYAEAGSDIVCAAVSALAENTVNSIEAFTEDGTLSVKVDVLVESSGIFFSFILHKRLPDLKSLPGQRIF